MILILTSQYYYSFVETLAIILIVFNSQPECYLAMRRYNIVTPYFRFDGSGRCNMPEGATL